MMTKTICSIACVCLLAVASFASADSNAALIGTITDASGGRVAGAVVTVVSLATNVPYIAVSNDTGLYRVAGLPPGRYRAHVEKDGFKRVERADIDLHVQDEASLNVQLQVGPLNEAVTVAATRPLINTTSGAVGTVVDREFVANLPLNGRSFQSLISLTPGVVITAATSAAQGQFSVNGQRADANYFMVDGVSANVGISPLGAQNSSGAGSGIQANAFGGYSNFVSVDAMQEFRIETSSYAPEYGRLPGGQISIVSRSGSNAFHGDAFEYYRDTKFDANNWFNIASGAPRPPDRSDDWGGVIGGPILKNRVFFFASHEGQRLQVPQTVTANVPSLAARQNAVATMKPLLNAYPVPTSQCQTGTTNCDPNVGTFVGAYSNDNSMDATSVRVDGRLTASMTVFGRVNHAPSKGSIRSSQPSVVSDLTLNLDTVTLGHTWMLSPMSSNDLRFNYSYTPSYSIARLDTYGGAVPLPDSFMFISPYDPTTSTWGFSGRTIGSLSAGSAAYDQSSQFNVVDSFSWLRGSHQMKFGVDFRRMYPRADRSAFTQGLAATLTTASWVNGTLNQYTTSAFLPKDFTYYNVGAYAQDAWHATPRLTLTYGLRWDVNPPPGSPNGMLPAFTQVDLSNLAATRLAPEGTPAYETQWNAFAPRVGVAYQLSDDDRWGRVLRAGGGLFFDTAGAATGFSERAFVAGIVASPPFPIPVALQVSPKIPTSAPWGFISTANPHLRMPY
ncbi:MAG TPA: TonB-dependent receptor, partial [Vicinamibacterales bacterium]|nr:TonB-dependent receptor [Vicinamibacterales bacterium]